MTTQNAESKLEAVILDVINHQTDYMGSVVELLNWLKSYLRASNMMVSCLVESLEDAPEEQNARALARHLADMEAWVCAQDAALGERYCGIAVFNQMLQPAREGSSASPEFGPQG